MTRPLHYLEIASISSSSVGSPAPSLPLPPPLWLGLLAAAPGAILERKLQEKALQTRQFTEMNPFSPGEISKGQD